MSKNKHNSLSDKSPPRQLQKSSVWIFSGTALFALVLDVLTKIWVEKALLLHSPLPVVGGFFRFTLGYNTGMAFGLFANGGTLLAVITAFAIILLILWLIIAYRSDRINKLTAAPLGLIMGGAFANFADRLPDGRVTDFLDVGLGVHRWPTFNLADTFVSVGMIILILLSFFGKSTTEKQI